MKLLLKLTVFATLFVGLPFFPQFANAQTAPAHIVFSDTFQDTNGTGLNAHNAMWNCNVPDENYAEMNKIQSNALRITTTQTCTPPAVTNGSIEYSAIIDRCINRITF